MDQLLSVSKSLSSVNDPNAVPAAHPPRLLDDYLARAYRGGPDRLCVAALRSRSLAVRPLLAHAAARPPLPLAELIAAARARSVSGWQAHRMNPAAIAELARVIALQRLLREDQSDALALYDLALAHFGPGGIPPAHRLLHAQLAFVVGDRGRAAMLLDIYPDLPRQSALDLYIDLANPFLDPAGHGEIDWLSAFQGLLPEPHPVLTHPGDLPLDRLAAPAGQAVEAPERISVVVTGLRPGAGLLTSVRSLLDQSWTNLEILIVGDDSAPDQDVVIKQCLALDDRVRLVRRDHRPGDHGARNAGLAAATGEFVAFQHSGDWSHPRRLERQIEPLRAAPSVMAVTSEGLRVTEELTITYPGRRHRGLDASSLMIRREPVLRRIGYFDQVRWAEGEYPQRIKATFGPQAVRHLRGQAHTLNRRPPPDPASDTPMVRAAYTTAYRLWHRRIRSGTAAPYLAAEAAQRPFAAPTALICGDPPPAHATSYQVAFVTDWRRFGGTQKSTLEEIRSLTGRGFRVAVAHLEVLYDLTAPPAPFCDPVQELINAGTVDQVMLSDEVSVSLLIIRNPAALQFATTEPSGIRAERVVILADQPPYAPDGSDYRYSPRTCTEAARRLFGTEPRWCPQSPPIRDFLEATLRPVAVTPYHLPGVIDADIWTLDRRAPRLDRPVVGRHSPDHWTAWPRDRRTLLAAYPDSVDIRVMGGATTPRRVLGRDLPPNWVVYGRGEVDIRTFLHQIEFFVYFPHPGTADRLHREILEALAAGCVAVLPHQFARTFGEAAVYCHPSEVSELVQEYHADRRRYLEQSRRARRRVRKLHSHTAYTELVSTLLGIDDPVTGNRTDTEAN